MTVNSIIYEIFIDQIRRKFGTLLTLHRGNTHQLSGCTVLIAIGLKCNKFT